MIRVGQFQGQSSSLKNFDHKANALIWVSTVWYMLIMGPLMIGIVKAIIIILVVKQSRQTQL